MKVKHCNRFTGACSEDTQFDWMNVYKWPLSRPCIKCVITLQGNDTRWRLSKLGMGQLPLFAVWSGLGIVGVRNQDHAGV